MRDIRRSDGPALRLWPGVTAAIVLIAARFVIPSIAPDTLLYGLIAGAVAALVILLWWLLFSRAPWAERLGALALMVLSVVLLYQFAHISIRTGNMGFLLPAQLVFILPPVLVAWAVLTRRSSSSVRRITMQSCSCTSSGSPEGMKTRSAPLPSGAIRTRGAGRRR